jgi:hypothetical protein
MTSKRNIEDRVNDLEADGETDEDDVTDAGLGVTADFVTYEEDEDAPKYQVREENE